MAESARVTSIASITRFLGAMRGFAGKARVCVDDVSDDVRKIRQWLEFDRLPHWKHEIRERRKKLDAARQELFTAQLAGVGADTQYQQAQVNRAQRAVSEAEQKLGATRKWIRDFDTTVGPVKRQLDKMDAIIIGLAPRACARLDQIIRSLESYAAVTALPFSPSPAPGATTSVTGDEPAAGDDATATTPTPE